MKKLEKIGKSVLALSVLANTFMPLGIVSAEDPQPYTISITTSNTGWTVGAITGGIQVYDIPGNDIVGFIEVRDKSTNTPIEPHGCQDNVCLYTEIAANKTVNIIYNSETFDVTTTGEGGCLVDPGYDINGNLSVDVKTPAPNPIGKCGTQSNDPEQVPFTGEATLIWTCGTTGNEICYKQLTGLSSTEVNWIKGSTIEAENKPGVKFDVHAKEKFFSPQDLFESKKDDIDNGVIKVEDLKGPDGLDYMPVGEPIENNALVSYGNRQFKAVVYGDEFKGITIGDLDSLDYYPQAWNDWFLRRETYDMSGTTKEKPVEIDTVLLQKKINLKLQTDLNSYNITKIEALDVPSNVVIITKKDDGSYDLDFKSNFYDKVVFKVTTDDNKEQFIYINRRTTDPWIRTDDGKEGIVVETFYDRNKSYSDLDVIAKVINKDGSSKVVHLEAERGIDNGLGDIIDGYEVDEQTVGDNTTPKGKGMKRANFVYAMSKADLKKVDKIYINVGFKGSTETTYAGNFAGSGKGDVIDMKYWEDRL